MGYSQTFSRLTAPLGERVRMRLDPEGWPYIPCKYGRLEWRGKESDGRACVYAYTDRKKLLSSLRKVCTPAQIGDTEGVFRCDTGEQILRAAGLLHPRKKRPPIQGKSAEELATLRARFRAKEARG